VNTPLPFLRLLQPTLIISWFVSVLFVPYLGFLLLKKPAHATPEGAQHEHFDTPFYERFRVVVAWCIDHRKKAIMATIATFVLGIVGMSQVQQQFFPDSSRPEIIGRYISSRRL